MQQQNKRVSKIADIGELNKRIQLMKMMDTGKINPNTGEDIRENSIFAEVWAKVSALHGQEYYTAVSVKLEKQLSFIIRYRNDIDENTNIWFENRGYNIGFIDYVKYGHEYMEIKAEYSRGVYLPR
ncbi:phage head closure protein [Ligilactobacillus acidipiscis]|uniref:Bacteriophage head-tail adaptor n=1 Tax=Ligilactobacillus acidipiscis TaxID=89059 RepID=A0A1K1KQF7_9LACO|nr:phage head closure protein [Ligilactobacillus acidipiscis]SFV41090.1 Bacteriophage head-tail adaptor [Ligilactobacillus acidipiscis]